VVVEEEITLVLILVWMELPLVVLAHQERQLVALVVVE
jgi:hypothetical protein